jgi:tight adherence protein C
VVDASHRQVGRVIAASAAAMLVLALAWRSMPRVPARRPPPSGHRYMRAWSPPALFGADRRRRELDRAYPDALELLVLAVGGGALPHAAIESILPHLPAAVTPAFAAVHQRASSGERFADALGALVDHLGHQARPLVDSLAAADRYGLPLGPVLDRLAAEARQHRRRLADARARQLPVRLSIPLVLCTLPSFVLLAIVPLLLGAISSLTS